MNSFTSSFLSEQFFDLPAPFSQLMAPSISRFLRCLATADFVIQNSSDAFLQSSETEMGAWLSPIVRNKKLRMTSPRFLTSDMTDFHQD
jgi:hypothetical protein